MADIAPAMSFYFGFGFLAATSGIASPLTIITAGIAIAFLANTLSRYMQAHPSTGSFITFIGMALGPVLALTTAIVLISGYLVNIFSIMAISGGFMTMFLQNYFHGFPTWTWPIFVLAFVGGAAFLMIRGVHLSVRWAGAFFIFEFTILVLVSVIALIQNAGHLNLHPFDPHYLLSGVKGLGLGFPLAVYLFIGWEAAGPMAEETDQPRKNIPRALFASVALMLGSFVLFAYATVEAFGENVTKLTAAPHPVHRGGPEGARPARLPRLHRRRDLDGRLPDRRRELAGPPDVQLGPRRAAAEVAGQGVREARHTGQRAGDLPRHRAGRLLRLGVGAAHHADRALRRAVDPGNDPRDHRVCGGQPVAAGLLPQALSQSVQRRSGPHPAGRRHGGDRLSAVPAGEARPALAVQLVPLRRRHADRGGADLLACHQRA